MIMMMMVMMMDAEEKTRIPSDFDRDEFPIIEDDEDEDPQVRQKP